MLGIGKVHLAPFCLAPWDLIGLIKAPGPSKKAVDHRRLPWREVGPVAQIQPNSTVALTSHIHPKTAIFPLQEPSLGYWEVGDLSIGLREIGGWWRSRRREINETGWSWNDERVVDVGVVGVVVPIPKLLVGVAFQAYIGHDGRRGAVPVPTDSCFFRSSGAVHLLPIKVLRPTEKRRTEKEVGFAPFLSSLVFWSFFEM